MAWEFTRSGGKKPTPASFVFWVRIYTTFMVAFLAWMPTATFISHQFQDIATSIIGLTVTVANILLPFFSVVNDNTDIPVEQVTSMEEKPKP